MKRCKKIISLLAAAALMVLLPGANTLQVSAAPTTYYVKYDIDQEGWRMQVHVWNNELEGREAYYLNSGSDAMKDGDVLVVLENSEHEGPTPDLPVNAHLSNLTVNRANVVISTGGVDECHILGGSYAAVSGNITNAYVYDDGVCTFNNDVTNLRLIATVENTVETSVSVKGTVAYASESNGGGILKEYYNFVKGTFYFDSVAGLMTDPSLYSTTGSAPAAAAANETTTAAQQPQSAASANSGEYDDVPKTGENNMLFMILLAVSAVSFAGCMALNLRKTR